MPRHAATSDFLNSQLVAQSALMLTVGSLGGEDVILTQDTLPKGSSIRLAGVSLSSSSIIG